MNEIKPVAGCIIDKAKGLCDPFMAKSVLDPTIWDEPYVAKLFDQSTIDALKAEAESLRADAERYRWLRSLDGSCDAAACVNINIGFDWIEQHGEQLDAAIDAARKGAGTDVRYTVTAKGREMLGARNGG